MITMKHCLLAASTALLLSPLLALPAAAQASQPINKSSDQRELYNYTLTMDKIRRLAATQKDLEAAERDHPALSRSEDSESASGNLDQAAQALEKSPQAVAAIRKNGFTPREYVVASMALIQAGAAEDFKKSGAYPTDSARIKQLVSPANLTFLEQHRADIAKLMPAFAPGGAGNHR